jgi:hypothetical protein
MAKKDQINVEVLLSNIQRKFNLSTKELVDLSKEEIVLPISIFNDKLGMLEAASLYLRDTLKLSFKDIARLLKRDYKTIWTSYTKAKEKMRND